MITLLNIISIAITTTTGLSTNATNIDELTIQNVFDEVVGENILHNEQQIAAEVVERLNISNETDKELILQKTQLALNNMSNYDFILGSPMNEVIEYIPGANDTHDFMINNILNMYVRILYPELANFSPNSRFSALPDRNSPTYESDVSRFLQIIETRSFHINEATNRVIAHIDSGGGDHGDYHYFENYNSNLLDQRLKDYEVEMAALQSANATKTFLAYITYILCPPVGAGLLFAFGAEYLWYAAYDINYFGALNDYEVAVLFHYRDIVSPINFALLTDKPRNTALSYFPDYNGATGNNTLDAFRHTYWNALMALEYGGTVAKEFGDAHEYSDVKANRYSSDLDKKYAIDMDLMNNAAGRRIASLWKRNKNTFFVHNADNLNVPRNEWDALAFYTLDFVADGYTNSIYTFSADDGKYVGELSRNKHNLVGLKNTNFDLDDVLGDNSDRYFNFAPYC